MGEAAVVLNHHRAPDAVEAVQLTAGEEAELRAFFAMFVPPAPGECSGVGAMCARLANAKNPSTIELPTAFVVNADGTTSGAPWTQIPDCPIARSLTNDGEDAMIAHVDALRRMRRVRAALDATTPRDRRVLAAYYESDEANVQPPRRSNAVAALTVTATAENRQRAAEDHHETIEETIARVVSESKRTSASKIDRQRAKAIVDAVRREAADMLNGARAAYARARRGR